MRGWRRALAIAALAVGMAACGDEQPPPGPQGAGAGAESAAPSVPPTEPGPPRPNVILVTLESARADRLGPYGAAGGMSPHLDQLAADGVVYEHAYTPSTTTLAAHASLLTGRLPGRHGAGEAQDGAIALPDVVSAPEGWQGQRAHPLPADVPTLAERLRAAGYATAAVVSGPWLVRAFGLGRGFDLYDDRGVETLLGLAGSDVTDSALAWLEADPRRPVLLFVSYFEPHAPYQPPLELARRLLGESLEALPAEPDLAETNALYDAELSAADAELGRLLDGLRARGLYDDAWILVTADHGVLLGEHVGLGSGESLWEQELRVPLVVKPPRGHGGPGRRAEPALLTDVLPMLLAALGLPLPDGVDGGVPGQTQRPLIAELPPSTSRSGAPGQRALIEWPWKLHVGAGAAPRLYDLGTDPGEQNDVAGAQEERVARMTAVLDAYAASLPAPLPPTAAQAPTAEGEPASR